MPMPNTGQQAGSLPPLEPQERAIVFIIIGALFVGLAAVETALAIRKWGPTGLTESRLLVAHLVLYALAGVVAVLAGPDSSRLAVLAFGAIIVVDTVMRWVGRRRMATKPTG
jgi:hypothetical protein